MDLVDPYTVTDTTGSGRVLNTIVFIDPATGWFALTKIPGKSSQSISQIFNGTWFTRYPRPQKILFDNKNEFKKFY